MTISELIAECGDDNVKYQWLSECIVKAFVKPKHADIVFRTERQNAMSVGNDNPDLVGIILWVPGWVIDRIAEENKKEGVPG